jgi:hypothetical protein
LMPLADFPPSTSEDTANVEETCPNLAVQIGT